MLIVKQKVEQSVQAIKERAKRFVMEIYRRVRTADRFPIGIAFGNSLGYCLAVGIPTVIDPLLKHHVIYGARSYPLGYWVFLGAPVVFYLSYRCSSKFKGIRGSILVFLSACLPALATLPNFLPEFPHAFVTANSIPFSAFSAAANYIHYIDMDRRLEFVYNKHIPVDARIKRIEIEYSSWSKLLLGFLTMYAVICVTILVNLSSICKSITTDASEAFLLQLAFFIYIILNVIWFVVALVVQLLKKMMAIADKLLDIEKE